MTDQELQTKLEGLRLAYEADVALAKQEHYRKCQDALESGEEEKDDHQNDLPNGWCIFKEYVPDYQDHGYKVYRPDGSYHCVYFNRCLAEKAIKEATEFSNGIRIWWNNCIEQYFVRLPGRAGLYEHTTFNDYESAKKACFEHIENEQQNGLPNGWRISASWENGGYQVYRPDDTLHATFSNRTFAEKGIKEATEFGYRIRIKWDKCVGRYWVHHPPVREKMTSSHATYESAKEECLKMVYRQERKDKIVQWVEENL